LLASRTMSGRRRRRASVSLIPIRSGMGAARLAASSSAAHAGSPSMYTLSGTSEEPSTRRSTARSKPQAWQASIVERSSSCSGDSIGRSATIASCSRASVSLRRRCSAASRSICRECMETRAANAAFRFGSRLGSRSSNSSMSASMSSPGSEPSRPSARAASAARAMRASESNSLIAAIYSRRGSGAGTNRFVIYCCRSQAASRTVARRLGIRRSREARATSFAIICAACTLIRATVGESAGLWARAIATQSWM